MRSVPAAGGEPMPIKRIIRRCLARVSHRELADVFQAKGSHTRSFLADNSWSQSMNDEDQTQSSLRPCWRDSITDLNLPPGAKVRDARCQVLATRITEILGKLNFAEDTKETDEAISALIMMVDDAYCDGLADATAAYEPTRNKAYEDGYNDGRAQGRR
jgi:hypothetical protein